MALNPAVWPDIEYIADQIAEHYRDLRDALDRGDLSGAERHLAEMERRVEGLRTYVAVAGDQ